MHVDDMADACIHIMKLSKSKINLTTGIKLSHINIGSGQEVTIRELAKIIARISNYNGKIEFDTSYPDGTPRKILNLNKINSLGWQSKIHLVDGLKDTYEWFLKNKKD